MSDYGVTITQISEKAREKLQRYIPHKSNQSQTGSIAFVRQLFRHRLSIVGAVIIFLAIFMAVFAPLISPFDPLKIDLRNVYAQPSISHPLGTDLMGRDSLSRIFWGARISLITGVLATIVSATAGTLLGLIAGYYGGKIDAIIMRVTDVLMCFPAFIFTISLAAALGAGIGNLILAISLHAWTGYCRIIRGQVISVKNREYVQAAKVIGAIDYRIMVFHVFKNSLAPLIVASSLSIGGNIMTEAAASFLGIGVQPPTPSWGIELRSGYGSLLTNPWLSMAPGLCITLLVLAFNFIGDGLRDVLDPRMRYRY